MLYDAPTILTFLTLDDVLHQSSWCSFFTHPIASLSFILSALLLRSFLLFLLLFSNSCSMFISPTLLNYSLLKSLIIAHLLTLTLMSPLFLSLDSTRLVRGHSQPLTTIPV